MAEIMLMAFISFDLCVHPVPNLLLLVKAPSDGSGITRASIDIINVAIGRFCQPVENVRTSIVLIAAILFRFQSNAF